jgi:hypothetical protein
LLLLLLSTLLLLLLLLLLFVIVVHCYCFCFVIEQTSLNIISVNAIGDEPLSTQGRALRGPGALRGGAPRVGTRRIHHSRTRYLASQLLSITTAIIININTITITPCVAELNGGN